ncbi:MAG: cell division regulator GpsB [Mollicutes bacterium]|nr:cell division regulator GpsB [Mollicutes bacterium]
MYSEKLFLTPQDILEKEFKVDARGYRPQEVDKYLDMIIRDYNELLNVIKSKEKEIRELMEDNSVLKKEIRYLKEQLETKNETEVATRMPNNIDLLKRISNLEKIVYGKEE